MIPVVFLTDAQAWGIALACAMMVADVVVGFIVAAINESFPAPK